MREPDELDYMMDALEACVRLVEDPSSVVEAVHDLDKRRVSVMFRQLMCSGLMETIPALRPLLESLDDPEAMERFRRLAVRVLDAGVETHSQTEDTCDEIIGGIG